MTASKRSTGLVSEDDAPDLSTPEWKALIDATPLRRGRPKAAVTKTLVSLRLDPDVVDAFRATGPGWQGRINDTLRKAVQGKKRA